MRMSYVVMEAAAEHLATSPYLEGASARFFNGVRESRALDAAYHPVGRRKLRQLTLELVRLSGHAWARFDIVTRTSEHDA